MSSHQRAHARTRTAVAAAIAGTATLVGPAAAASPPASTSVGLPGVPQFFAGVVAAPAGSNGMNIYRSANGRVAAPVPVPGQGLSFTAVARLGGDSSFVAAAITSKGCTSQLYWFTINHGGQPSRLKPLSVPKVTGTVMELVSSASGNALVYTVSGPCTPRGKSIIGVIRPATGMLTTWTYKETRSRRFPASNVSLTADGSVLGFTGGPSTGFGDRNAFTLPTSTPHGSLTRHARVVLRVPLGIGRAVLSNDGSQEYVEELMGRHGDEVLSVYSTATGQRTRVLGRVSPGGEHLIELSYTPDAAGQHLLFTGSPLNSKRMTEMSIRTGHTGAVTLDDPPLGPPFDSDAW
jgi:hypothetical protein